MEKMYHSFVKDLKNVEFHELFILLSNYLNSKKLEGTILQKPVKKIDFHRNKLILLKHAKPGHPLTRVINKKLRIRTEYLVYFRMTINANLLSYVPENRIAASKLKIWLDHYKKNLYKSNYKSQNTLVRSMIDDTKKLGYVKEGISMLNLEELMDTIKELTDEIFNHTLERRREKISNKSKIVGLREHAYSDLKTLISALKVTYNWTSDEEERERIKDLSFGINDLLKSFRTDLRSRRTKSKNKKERARKEALAKSKKPENTNLPMVVYDMIKLK